MQRFKRGISNFSTKEVLDLSKKYLHHLSKREQLVIVHRYGGIHDDIKILQKSYADIVPFIKNDITGECDLTPERIYQILRKAIVKMDDLRLSGTK